MVLLLILKILSGGFGAGNGGGELATILIVMPVLTSVATSIYVSFKRLRKHKDAVLTALFVGIVFMPVSVIAMLDMLCSYAMFSAKDAGTKMIGLVTETHPIHQLFREGLMLSAVLLCIFIFFSVLERRDMKKKRLKEDFVFPYEKHIIRLIQNNLLEYCFIAVIVFICVFGLADIPLPEFIPLSTWYSLFVYLSFAATGKGVFVVLILLLAPIFSKHGNSAIKASEHLDGLDWLRSWIRRRYVARAWMAFVFTSVIVAGFIPAYIDDLWVHELAIPHNSNEAKDQNIKLHNKLARIEQPEIVYIRDAFWPDGADLCVIVVGDIYAMLCKVNAADIKTYESGEINALTGRLNGRKAGEQELALKLLTEDNPSMDIPPISHYYIDSRENSASWLPLVIAVLSPFVLFILYQLFVIAVPDLSKTMRRIRREVPDIETFLPRLKMELENRQILFDGKGLWNSVTVTESFITDEGFMRIIPIQHILSAEAEYGGGARIRVKLNGRSFAIPLHRDGLTILHKQMTCGKSDQFIVP